jgi:alpha-beta hydrolase superfamily lysophospholipase/thiol-disulfide isomerase/thioredoxin
MQRIHSPLKPNSITEVENKMKGKTKSRAVRGSTQARVTALASAVTLALALCTSVSAWPGGKKDSQKYESKDQQTSETKDLKKNDSKDPQKNAPLSSSDQNSAPIQCWSSPLAKPRCCLLCIHGLGLYSGAYQNFGMRMAKHGIITYAIDVRGFGSWMKAQGHQEVDFPGCLEDVKVALKAIHSANPGLPVFLLGESMGGAIALRATSMYPDLVDGLISSVPAGERFKQKKTDLKVALELLTGPNKQHNVGKSVVQQATQDEKLRQDWANNPLDRMNLSAKELVQFQKFMNENHDAAKEISKTPVLFVQGSEDRLVKPEGTWDLFNEQATELKTFLAVPSEHLIFEEQQDHSTKFDERVAQLVTAWIFAHTANGAGVLASQAETRDLLNAINKIVNGKFPEAKVAFDALIAANPNDERAHYWLGVTYMKMKQPALARTEFQTAMRMGKGTDPAMRANNELMALADGSSAQASAGKPQIPANFLSALGAGGKPVVLAFYAPWAEECKGLDDMFAKAPNAVASKVKFIKVNIDDHGNDDLVKACSVGPIPTFVYLTSDGHIASTSIGKNNFGNFAKGFATASH